jgi:hypothetical protein
LAKSSITRHEAVTRHRGAQAACSSQHAGRLTRAFPAVVGSRARGGSRSPPLIGPGRWRR